MLEFTPIVAAGGDAPPIPLQELIGPGEVLVLAPHPDDESLAMGGAIAAATDAGYCVTVAIVTDGSRSHPNSRNYPPVKLAAVRREEAAAAVRILTSEKAATIWLGYPDTAAPDDCETFRAVKTRLESFLPHVSAIWTTWNGDPHVDHQRVCRLACWLAKHYSGIKVFACPVWGRILDPMPDAPQVGIRRFPTAPYRFRKRQAVAAHVSQMTGMIEDDPEGFCMPEELVRHFIETDEIFIPL